MILRWLCDILVMLTTPIGFILGFIPNLIFISIAFVYQFESDEDKLALAKFFVLNMGYKPSNFDSIYSRNKQTEYINM